MNRRTFIQSIAALASSLALPSFLQAKRTLSDPNILPTGIHDLDYCLNGGLPRGQIVLFAGGIASGKSSMVTRIQEQARRFDKTKELTVIDFDDVAYSDPECRMSRSEKFRCEFLRVHEEKKFGVAMITLMSEPRVVTMATRIEPYISSPHAYMFLPYYVVRLMKDDKHKFHGKIIKSCPKIPASDFNYRVTRFGSGSIAANL